MTTHTTTGPTATDSTTTTDGRASDPGTAPADLSMYYLIHRALGSGAERIATAVRRCEVEGDWRRIDAVAAWYRGYQEELHLHHHLEDDEFFPALHDRVPVMAEHEPRLHHEHELVVAAMDRTDAALTALAAAKDDRALRAEAVAATTELRDILVAHLAYEDADILPLFVRHFGAEEYEELEQAAMKSAPLRTQVFTVPFMVEAMQPGGERETLMASAPMPLRVLYRLTRRRYARMTGAAFG